jgi:spore germination protein KB
MQKEFITSWQASCILVMFIFGSTLVFGIGNQAGQDTWITLLFTLAMAIPAVLIYARIISLLPGKDLFEIMEELFGRFFGKILIVLFSWYAIHLGASVLRNFTDFIQVVSLPETPQLPVAILMIAVVIYLTKSGVHILGKWAAITLTIIGAVIVFTVLFSLRSLDPTSILPVMDHSLGTITTAAFQQFALPFGETVLLLGIAGSLKKEDSPYKAYLYGILIAGFISLLTILRNIMLLGTPLMQAVYYPSFVAAKIINTGDFFARIESLISMNYLFAGVTKIALCLLAAAKGLTVLFNLQNYKKILAPACLLTLAFSATFYNSVMHLFDFVEYYYPIYAVPFQIIIPLLVWIGAELKAHKKNGSKIEE